MGEQPYSFKNIFQAVQKAEPQKIIALCEKDAKKLRRNNIAYIFSQVITIISTLAIEKFLVFPSLIVPYPTASYPSASPVEKPDFNAPLTLLTTSGVTGWYILTNKIYEPLKYHGKRTYWLKLLFKITTIVFFGIGLFNLFYWFVSHNVLSIQWGGGMKYGVYFRRSPHMVKLRKKLKIPEKK
jgi:hypothetical protein